MKCRIEFELPDNGTIFEKVKVESVKWTVWGYSGLAKVLPQGEWIDAEIPLESGGAMSIQVCSLCKTFYPLAYTGGGHRFCPHCGARMEGADDE